MNHKLNYFFMQNLIQFINREISKVYKNKNTKEIK